MATQIGSLFYKIFGDTTQLDKSLKNADGSVKKTGKSFSKFGALLKGAAVAGAAIVAAKAIGKLGIASIKAASDAEETRNKFDVVFRDVSDAAEESARVLDESYGLSNTASLDLLANTGDLLAGFGFTQTAALDLSTQVNQLAVDLGSFQNVGAKEASEALTKALLGERESVKQLGISILDADVKLKVLELTQQGMTFETERQAKAYATLQLAIAQSGNAIGDYSRSQASMANQSKEARAAVDDLKAAIGERLLPIATESVKVFAGLTQRLADFIAERKKLKDAEDAENKSIEQRILLAKEELKDSELFLRVKNIEIETFRDFNQSLEEQEESLAAIRETFAAEESARVQTALDDLFKLQIEKQSGVAASKEELEAKREILAEEKEIEDERNAAAEEAIRIAEERAVIDERSAEVRAELAQNEVDMLDEANALAIQNYRDRNAEILESAEELAAAQIDLFKMVSLERIADTQFWTSQAQSVIGAFFDFQLASLQNQLDNEEITQEEFDKKRKEALKKQAKAEKLFKVFDIGIATARNVVEVFPNPFLIAAAIALGATQAGLVAATPIPAFAQGGIVPGSSFSGDKVPAMVNSGEAIFNKQQQQRLLDLADGSGGGSQTINVYVGTKKVATEFVDAINNGQGGTIDSRVVR